MSPSPEFDALLRRHLKYLAADAALSEQSPLKELGLDSMEAVELLFDLEDVYGITLPDDALSAESFATPAALYAVVRAATGQEVLS